MTTNLNTAGTVSIDPAYHWRLIDEHTPSRGEAAADQ